MRIHLNIVFTFLLLSIFNNSLVSQNLPSHHYKVENIQTVINEVAEAYGSVRKTPALRVSRIKNFIAEYEPSTMEIAVSESFYDFCSGFGEDSMAVLACIVGHELGHYYLDHDYAGGFNEILGRSNNNDISLENKKFLEARADIFGLKYAYFAGYPSYNVLPGAIEKIYNMYPVSSSEGYPTKNQRIQIAKDQTDKIKGLVYLYQMAVFLHANHYLNDAATLYNYLLQQDFVNAETLNNLGTVKFSQAMDIYDKESRAELFLFPSEIDSGERLQSIINNRGISKTNLESKEILLIEAERYFRQALERNPSFATSFINLSGLLVYRGDVKGSHLMLDNMYDSFVSANMFLPANYYLIRGLCFTLENNFEQGYSYISKAKTKGAYKAEENLKAFHFYKGLYKLPSFDIEQTKIECVNSYLELIKSEKSINKTTSFFDLRIGDFALASLKNENLKKVINYPSQTGPFYFSYDDDSNGLLKCRLELANKSFYMIGANRLYGNVTPAGIKPGDLHKNISSILGALNVSFSFSNATGIEVYWDKKKSNTGLFLETKKGVVTSIMFFLLEN